MEDGGLVIPISSGVGNPDCLTGAVHVWEDYWKE